MARWEDTCVPSHTSCKSQQTLNRPMTQAWHLFLSHSWNDHNPLSMICIWNRMICEGKHLQTFSHDWAFNWIALCGVCDPDFFELWIRGRLFSHLVLFSVSWLKWKSINSHHGTFASGAKHIYIKKTKNKPKHTNKQNTQRDKRMVGKLWKYCFPIHTDSKEIQASYLPFQNDTSDKTSIRFRTLGFSCCFHCLTSLPCLSVKLLPMKEGSVSNGT